MNCRLFLFLCKVLRMKKILAILLLVLIAHDVQAQRYIDSIVQYFDGDWKRVDSNKRYQYFRIAKKLPDSTWHVRDYFAHGLKLKMEGVFIDDSFKVQDGKFYYYHYNGNVSKECSYNKGKYVGLYRAYNHKGALLDSTRYKSTGIPFHKSFQWDDKGRLITYEEYDMEGKGIGSSKGWWPDSIVAHFGKFCEGHLKDSVWTYYHKSGNMSLQEIYAGGKLMNYICYNVKGELTTGCDTSEKMPSPPYVMNDYLARNMRMPVEAREGGLQGNYRVLVGFTLDTDGKIIDVEAENETYYFFIEEALKIVKGLPPWQPGRQHNRNVPVWYTLPISFRLE